MGAADRTLFSAGLMQQINDGGTDLEFHGVGVDVSSEEEEEDLIISSDVSLDESDIPLHSDILLSAEQSQDGPASGVDPESEGSGLVGLKVGARPAQVIIDERQATVPAEFEPSKLSSKLSHQQNVASTSLPSDSQTRDEPAKASRVGSAASSHDRLGKVKTDSLTTLSSYLAKDHNSLETAIVSAIGLEKLTQLGRVGSARITMGSLKLEPSFIRQILTQHTEKRVGKAHSSILLPTHSTKRCGDITTYMCCCYDVMLYG